MSEIYLVISQVNDWDSEILHAYSKKSLALKQMKKLAREKIKEEKEYMSIAQIKECVMVDEAFNFSSDDTDYSFRIEALPLETEIAQPNSEA